MGLSTWLFLHMFVFLFWFSQHAHASRLWYVIFKLNKLFKWSMYLRALYQIRDNNPVPVIISCITRFIIDKVPT